MLRAIGGTLHRFSPRSRVYRAIADTSVLAFRPQAAEPLASAPNRELARTFRRAALRRGKGRGGGGPPPARREHGVRSGGAHDEVEGMEGAGELVELDGTRLEECAAA